MNELLAAYQHVSHNWIQISISKLCGCCNCLQIFSTDEISAWTGLELSNIEDPKAIANQTALCPRCGSEAVMGDASGFPITTHFLGRMNEAWFQRTMVRRPMPKP